MVTMVSSVRYLCATLLFLHYAMALPDTPQHVCDAHSIDVTTNVTAITANIIHNDEEIIEVMIHSSSTSNDPTASMGEKITCSVNVYPRDINVIRLTLSGGENDPFSYVYVESLDNVGSACTASPHLSFYSNNDECVAYLPHGMYRFHFENAHVNLKMRGVYRNDSRCSDSVTSPHDNQTSPPICNYTAYTTAVRARSSLAPALDMRFIKWCPARCHCTLDFRRLTQVCDENDVTTLLIIYDLNIKALNFKMIGLTNITSASFCHFGNLTSVNLLDNRLAVLPMDLFAVTFRLESIRLTLNQLTALPAGIFDTLRDLQILGIDYNFLVALPQGIFDSLINLSWLNLNYNRLTSFPTNLFVNLINVHTLTLSGDRALVMHTGLLDNMVALCDLNFVHVRITSLSAGIFQRVVNLEKLRLYECDLTEIPSALLHGLALLNGLSLPGSKIVTLSSGMFKSQSRMTSLVIYKAGLSTLGEDAFEGLTSLRTLRIESNRLYFLPQGIFEPFIDLEILKISNNLVTSIPAGIFRTMNKTTLLEFGNNSLISLENGTFYGLSTLNTLELTNNKLVSLSLGAFDALVKLSILRLAKNKLESLPQGVFDAMRELSILALQNNQLTNLSMKTVGNLTMLDILDLGSNRLIALPSPSFGGCARRITILYCHTNKLASLISGVFRGMFFLEYLYLAGNQLTTLPSDVFQDCAKLNYLKLNNNKLVTLPNGVFDGLVSLEDVFLANNDLTTLNNDTFDTCLHLDMISITGNNLSALHFGVFTNLLHLRWLYLEYNQIRSVQTKMLNVKLDHLKLSNNMLASLSVGVFDSLVDLKYLGLEHNLLASLHAGTFDFTIYLLSMNLGYNRLQSLPAGLFDALGGLERLYLNNNQLTLLPVDVFRHNNFLLELSLHSNSLLNLPQVFSPLPALRLSNNRLSTLPEDAFYSMINLHDLQLAYNNLSSLPPLIFQRLSLLKFLDISSNNITELPTDIFQELFQLLFLNISNNGLRYLPSMTSLISLEALNLNGNELSSIDHNAFEYNSALKILFMHKNRIKSLLSVEIFQYLSNLQLLNLRGNFVADITPGLFLTQSNVSTLVLSHNRLSTFRKGLFSGLIRLRNLDLDQNQFRHLALDIFNNCSALAVLNASHNSILSIDGNIRPKITIFDLRYNKLFLITTSSFDSFRSALILVDESATCCFVTNASSSTCISRKSRSVYLTCKRMLDSIFLKVSMWFLGVFAILCNCLAFYLRYHEKERTVQSILILHLSFSDFLMGVNMIMLSFADVYYAEFFPSYMDSWREGPMCKVAGVLSILSSEVSVFIVTLITIDRFQGVRNPMGINRLGVTSTRTFLACIWTVGVMISVAPIGLSDLYPNIFQMSEVCVGIPLVRRPIVTIETKVVKISRDLDDISSCFYAGVIAGGVIEDMGGIDVWEGDMGGIPTGGIGGDPPGGIGGDPTGGIGGVPTGGIGGVPTGGIGGVPSGGIGGGGIASEFGSEPGGTMYYVVKKDTVTHVQHFVSEIVGSQSATYYSIILFIAVNFICFLLVAILYTFIFISAKKSFSQFGRQNVKREMRMALKMALIVFTDFLCWVPLVIVCILAQFELITVHPEVYAWTVAFILPINSAINPFLYTIVYLSSDKK